MPVRRLLIELLIEHKNTSENRFLSPMSKGKGIRFIVLYPLEVLTRPCSPSRPVHTETISIPRGIFQSSWQHIAHKL